MHHCIVALCMLSSKETTRIKVYFENVASLGSFMQVVRGMKDKLCHCGKKHQNEKDKQGFIVKRKA